MYYSAIGLLAVVILLIENKDVLWQDTGGAFDKPVWKVYRRFLFAVMAYYITDILWGILESRKLTLLLFADTTVYYAAMAAGVLFWTQFTVSYLEERTESGRLLVYAGRIVGGLITLLTVVNIFTPVLFLLEEGCVYRALPVSAGSYRELSSSGEYEAFEQDKEGGDFIKTTREAARRYCHPADLNRFLSTFTRENVMEEIRHHGIFILTYRIMAKGVPLYVQLKAALIEEKEGIRMIVGISDIDAQVRQEEEYVKTLSRARIDKSSLKVAGKRLEMNRKHKKHPA